MTLKVPKKKLEKNKQYKEFSKAYDIGYKDCKKEIARSLPLFKEFLADSCYDLKQYKEGKYDRKILNFFINL